MSETVPTNRLQNYYSDPKDVVYIRRYCKPCKCCFEFVAMREAQGSVYALYRATTFDEAQRVCRDNGLIPVMVN